MTDRPTMTVTTPGVGDEQIAEEIQLPPEEFWDVPPAPAPEPSGSAAAMPGAAPAPQLPVAELEFIAPVHREVPLNYPFRWGGQDFERIVLRKLSGAQLRPFADLVSAGGDNADFAGFLAGLPGAVIRGLEATDALAVTEAAMDFLPPAYRTALGWPSASETSSGGVVSPSP